MIEITEEQQAQLDRMLELKLKRLRAHRLLVDAPAMVAHILAQVVPAGGVPGPRVSGGEKAPLPLNARALEDANSLYSQLVNWSISHARALGVMPPSSTLFWYVKDADSDGFPSWTEGHEAFVTRAVTDWLLAAEEKISHLPVAEDYWDDLRAIMGPLYGRYPRTVPRPPFASRSCPVCDRKTVIVNLDDETDEVTVACTYCGQVIPSAAAVKYLDEMDRKLEKTR